MSDMRPGTQPTLYAGAWPPAAVRLFEYGRILASCAAIVVCGACLTKSAAAGGLENPRAGAIASAGQASPIFDITIPKDYRDWRLISVAHETGDLNDIRAVLGNDAAIKTYREGKFSFPDGAIIARLAWKYVPADEDNKVFGREQSFVAGPQPIWYLQLMVKDQQSTPRQAGGDSRNLTRTAIPLLARRNWRPVSPVTCRPKHRTTYTRITHPEIEKRSDTRELFASVRFQFQEREHFHEREVASVRPTQDNRPRDPRRRKRTLQALVTFTTNPAGAAIVNAVGPIRQLVEGETTAGRRYLVIASSSTAAPGKPVQIQIP
jgi:Cytochrome P460